MRKLVVIAIGGNSLIKDSEHHFVKDQYDAICETVKYIVDIIEDGYEVIITHGNGPQVGFIMRRAEIAEEVEHMHPVPLVNCDADTQGAIGYQIQQALQNEFFLRKIKRNAVSVVTQVEVSSNDVAFENPTKHIGVFYNEKQVKDLALLHPEWTLTRDANRGYRRVVASPKPLKIIEIDAIKALAEQGLIVIAVGGGGIPVIRNDKGILQGVNAVIDKDYASSMLATQLNADIFMISTGVKNVYVNFGSDNEKEIKNLNLREAKILREEGQFAKGSMLPKINAVIKYLENGGGKAIITNPENLKKAIDGEAGTQITYK